MYEKRCSFRIKLSRPSLELEIATVNVNIENGNIVIERGGKKPPSRMTILYWATSGYTEYQPNRSFPMFSTAIWWLSTDTWHEILQKIFLFLTFKRSLHPLIGDVEVNGLSLNSVDIFVNRKATVEERSQILLYITCLLYTSRCV